MISLSPGGHRHVTEGAELRQRSFKLIFGPHRLLWKIFRLMSFQMQGSQGSQGHRVTGVNSNRVVIQIQGLINYI
ncbi:hypothetical protein EYF80_064161 [Liparis tanakae]|uniref:Uncharacterized protein n=1 Tax=Liparis tanakae TaxID=230148 RepID=A0A4Z2EA00_9TELE|nr:hypothetical protein EYF80_064161 [Liparis tanakae]